MKTQIKAYIQSYMFGKHAQKDVEADSGDQVVEEEKPNVESDCDEEEAVEETPDYNSFTARFGEIFWVRTYAKFPW